MEKNYKELIVYVKDSYYKYQQLFVDFLYEINVEGHFCVYERLKTSGEEKLVACFRNWDYFLINTL